MKKLLAAMCLLSATMAFAQARSGERMIQNDERGVPTFVKGDLGQLPAGPAGAAVTAFLQNHRDLLQTRGTESFEAIGSFRDELGQTHIRVQERLRGLPVFGAEYILHTDGNGRVTGMNGRLAADRDDLVREPQMDGWSAIERAVEQAGIEAPTYGAGLPRLTYVVNDRGNLFLAYSAQVAFRDANGDELDTIFADATTGDLVQRDSQYKHARNRQTYNANYGTTLPGTLVLSETSGSTTDSAINAAHNYAGVVYNYYSTVHGRDSYNNAGATIKSSAHYSSNYNNAYWDGTQMVYGDGDGTTFTSLSLALDVDAHELTHAVTEYSANLTYSNESGALNEATSDILGSSVEEWNAGSVSSNTWKIGEAVYTPGTSGDALRYMNDPALAGDSDYYPTRYTGTSDNGGVHTNSGIANLAFYLMTMGGTHPRSKTTTVVPALNATAATSINMAAKIWYRALTVYMTSSTNFAGARTATASAATDLYGAAAADSVNKAWEAVGVGGTSGGGTVTVLSNGVAKTSLGASTGSWLNFKISVPTGQSKLDIVMSGGTGDGDLYVKRGSQPTLSSYDYRPYLNGNAESVSVTNPASGDWYISIYAYSTFSGVSLKATYTASTGGTCTTYSGSLAGTGSSSYQPSTSGYTSSVSGTHTGKLTGTGTDFDLYLQKWNGSSWANVASSTGSTATESVTYSGTAGTYRWRVYSYSGSGTFSLCTTKP